VTWPNGSVSRDVLPSAADTAWRPCVVPDAGRQSWLGRLGYTRRRSIASPGEILQRVRLKSTSSQVEPVEILPRFAVQHQLPRQSW